MVILLKHQPNMPVIFYADILHTAIPLYNVNDMVLAMASSEQQSATSEEVNRPVEQE